MSKKKEVPGSNVDIQTGLSSSENSPHTNRAYKRHIANFLKDNTSVPVDLASLNLDILAEALEKPKVTLWLAKLKENGCGKQSLQQARAALIWLSDYVITFCGDERFDSIKARIQSVKVPEAVGKPRLGTWLTRPQSKQLISAVKKIRHHNPTLAARDRVMLLLLLICGLRRAEIVALCWRDFMYQGDYPVLVVHGKGDKPRQVKLTPEIVTALERWKTIQQAAGETEFVFTQVRKDGAPLTGPITPETIRARLEKLAESVDLPDVSPHDMRRTFARSAFEAGASMEMIRQTLGHASVMTTEKYVNAILELDHAATDIFAEALRKGKHVLDNTAVKPRDLAAVPELLTRNQAADYLSISIAQFDTLKKRAKIEAVRSMEEQPTTNAKTRPFSVYRREDVDRLASAAERLRNRSTKI